MGLIAWFKGLFSKKEINPEILEIETKLAILKLGQDLHAQTLTEIVERLKYVDDFKSLVANAFSNLDNRLEATEKLASYLYDKNGEHDEKLRSMEEQSTSNEFSRLASSMKNKEGD